MKKLYLNLIFIIFFLPAFAQKIELSGQVYTTFFRNVGRSSAAESTIYQASSDNLNNMPQNPYGSKFAVGYGLNVQAQLVLKSGLLFSLQTGYEQLSSKVNINYVYPYYFYLASASYYYVGPTQGNASGQVYLKNYAVNIAPSIGYRLTLNKLKLDLLPGIDIGVALKSNEHGQAALTTLPATSYPVNTPYRKPPADIRLRMGLALAYKRYAITAAFAHGLTNYQRYENNDYATYFSQTEVMRLGISYLIF